MLVDVRTINLGIAFALELATLAVFGAWALDLNQNSWLGEVIAVCLVTATVAIWARWAAPKAATRLGPISLLFLKFILFAFAVMALWSLQQRGLALAFAAAATANQCAAWIFDKD